MMTSPAAEIRRALSALRILSREQNSAILERNKLVATAEAERERLLAEAHREAASIVAAAREEAAAIAVEARMKGEAEAEEQWHVLLRNTADESMRFLDRDVSSIIEVASIIARRILGDWMASNSAVFASAVRSALSEDKRRGRCIAIRVHPSQATGLAGADLSAEITADPSLDSSTVVLEYNFGSVRCNPDEMAARARTLLLGIE